MSVCSLRWVTNMKSTDRSEVQTQNTEVLYMIFLARFRHIKSQAVRYLSLIFLRVHASLFLQRFDQCQWTEIYRCENSQTDWDALRISAPETKFWKFSSKICMWMSNMDRSIEDYVNKTHVLCVCLCVCVCVFGTRRHSRVVFPSQSSTKVVGGFGEKLWNI